MDEGLLELFEGINQDFLTLPYDEFTKKVLSGGSNLYFHSIFVGSPLWNDWTAFENSKNTVTNESLPPRLREENYQRLKYIVTEIITKIKTGSGSAPRKKITESVVNNISDPKIKQICIELNNTPIQNVLSLAQSLGELLKWTLWYRAQQVGTTMTVSNMRLSRLLEDAITHPYYSGNAAIKFLKDFKYGFLKTGYDMVRHDPAYIPDIVVLNPAIDALEHVLKETFPI